MNEAKALHRWYDVYAARVEGHDSRQVAICFTDITARGQAEEVLRQAHAQLERRIEERTGELAQAVTKLAAQAEQLRALSGELTLAEGRERRRLSRLLHDGLQQFLVAARMRIELVKRADPSRVGHLR